MAPRLTAELTAVPRFAVVGLLASTRTMWQFGQIADTMSTSSDSSTSQPVLPAADGSGLAAPFWFTTEKQPLPQAGSPHAER